MSRKVVPIVILAGALALMVAPFARAATPEVTEISLTGVVDPLMSRYVERGLKHAESVGAQAVLIRIDTPGGLSSSMREIVQRIQSSTVRVVCWVGPPGARAASAGAVILEGCPGAAMASGTNVGAAHPVGFTGDVLSEKATNDAAAYMRALAQKYGRNADLAERMVRDSVSVTADEALKAHAIDLIAPTEGRLLELISERAPVVGQPSSPLGGARIVPFEMSLFESLFHGIFDPNLAFLLLVLGLAGLVFEFVHPGISIPGVLGALAFLTSLMILGTLPVNVYGFAVIVAGIAAFVVESHTHAYGVAAALGVIGLVVGGLFLFNASVPNAQVSKALVIGLAIAVALLFTFVVRAVVRARRLPHMPSDFVALVGTEGVVVRALAPKGVVRAAREEWSARTKHGELQPGTPVRIVAAEGLTLDVEPIEVSTNEGSSP